MDFLEMTPEQLKEVVVLGTAEEMQQYLDSNDITLPIKAPAEWPAETEKFTRMLWQKLKVTPREFCADDDHDFQPTGKCEMARNEATLPGSCFRTEYKCTKCDMVMWKTEKEPEKKVEVAEEAPADDREARRAARKAEREAKKAAAEAAAE